MIKKILVSVIAAGCLSRFRGGVQFSQTPKEILVDDNELAVLESDSYLKVKVLSDDATAEGLAVDASIDTNAGADTAKDDDAATNDPEGTKVSEQPSERLAVITEAMRGLNLDVTADKPTVKQLKEQGLDVSAKERDEAWDLLVAEHDANNDEQQA